MTGFDKLKTAVLFLVFNRPDTTQKVFDEIRKARPLRLYLAADGPRANNAHEKEMCKKVKRIISEIDWPCKVEKLFRKKNLGCKIAVSSAIDWFFKNEREGIILEDDCLPNQSFFYFCQEMLKEYRTDSQIMHICGSNFQSGIKRGDGDYYFSKYAEMWGWATWRRAWKKYDLNMKSFPKFVKEKGLVKIFDKKSVRNYWLHILTRTYNHEIDTWDYQWIYTVWINNGSCIVPNVNLISNIGFRGDGTHTFDSYSPVSKLKLNNLPKNIKHPTKFALNYAADIFHTKNRFITTAEVLIFWRKSSYIDAPRSAAFRSNPTAEAGTKFRPNNSRNNSVVFL